MIKGFLRDESGQDVVEYSLLLVMVGVAALLIISAMGVSISGIFSKISDKLNAANNAIPE